MHDAKSRPLAKGDVVLIPMRVVETYEGEDFCNVGVETLYPRRPDAATERLTTNTGVMLRCRSDDTNDLAELQDLAAAAEGGE